jgi:crossover junction endodeoxyribonuclease RuvC
MKLKTSSCVLGIDPGLARAGWAVIVPRGSRTNLVGCGCLETPADWPTPERLNFLFQSLKKIIAKHRPDYMAVEKLFFTKNVSTGIAVAQARGAVLLAAADTGLPVTEFTPTAIKQAVTGDGRADKRQIQRMIKLLLRLDRLPRYDDTADAIAIALCGAASRVIN